MNFPRRARPHRSWVQRSAVRRGGGLRCAAGDERAAAAAQVLRPIGEGVKPVVENILLADMRRFCTLAQARCAAAP